MVTLSVSADAALKAQLGHADVALKTPSISADVALKAPSGSTDYILGTSSLGSDLALNNKLNLNVNECPYLSLVSSSAVQGVHKTSIEL